MEKHKTRVRDGDAVLVRTIGYMGRARWERGFVAESTDSGVWIVSGGRRGNDGGGYGRRRNTGHTATAHFYAESSDLWRRDGAAWYRERDERRERQKQDAYLVSMSNMKGAPSCGSHKQVTCKKKKTRPSKKPLPHYMEKASQPTYRPVNYVQPSYTAPSSVMPSSGVGGSSMSRGINPASISTTVKAKAMKVEKPFVVVPKMSAEEEAALRERELQLDEEYRERMAEKLRRQTEAGLRAAEEVGRGIAEVLKSEKERLNDSYRRGVEKAVKRQELLAVKLGMRPTSLRCQKPAQRVTIRGKADGFRGSLTTVAGGDFVVVFNSLSGSATIIRGPASFQLALSESVLPPEQANTVLSFAASTDDSSSIDLSDLVLPTSCVSSAVFPECCDPPQCDITELVHNTRTQVPDTDSVGLTASEVASQITDLEVLRKNGFILEEEYARRMASLKALQSSGWALSDRSGSRVKPKQVPVRIHTVHIEPTEPQHKKEQPKKSQQQQQQQQQQPKQQKSFKEVTLCEAISEWYGYSASVRDAKDAVPLGVDAERIKRELEGLDSLLEAGFIMEDEYARRKDTLSKSLRATTANATKS